MKIISVKVNWHRDNPISSLVRSALGISSKDCNTALWGGCDLSIFLLHLSYYFL